MSKKPRAKNDDFSVTYVIRIEAIQQFFNTWGVDVNDDNAYHKVTKALSGQSVDYLETQLAFIDTIVRNCIQRGGDAVIEKQGNLYSEHEVKTAIEKYYLSIEDTVKWHIESVLDDAIYYAKKRLATTPTVA